MATLYPRNLTGTNQFQISSKAASSFRRFWRRIDPNVTVCSNNETGTADIVKMRFRPSDQVGRHFNENSLGQLEKADFELPRYWS